MRSAGRTPLLLSPPSSPVIPPLSPSFPPPFSVIPAPSFPSFPPPSGNLPRAASDAAFRCPPSCSGLFGPVQVWSALFGVFGAGTGLFPIWSRRFRVVGPWSGLFRVVRLCSECSGPVLGCSLSGRGDFAWSGLGRGCSGLFGSVRSVRGGRRRASAGSVCCCEGATVSRRGVGWGAARRRGRFGGDSRSGAGMTEREGRGWRRDRGEYDGGRREWREGGARCNGGAVRGEIPAASAGMTDLGCRYDGVEARV